MSDQGNNQFNVMLFGLKNAGETYQRMMDKVFLKKIGEIMEVCVDDMIVKSNEEELHNQHLARVFQRVWLYNMRLDLEK